MTQAVYRLDVQPRRVTLEVPAQLSPARQCVARQGPGLAFVFACVCIRLASSCMLTGPTCLCTMVPLASMKKVSGTPATP